MLVTLSSVAWADGRSDAGKKNQLDRVVAVVNDAVILQSELEARLVPELADAGKIADPQQRRQREATLASQLLDATINEELIVQAAEAAKIAVSSSEVQAALDDLKRRYKLTNAALEQLLAQQGYTLASYKAELRRQLLFHRAINQLIAPKVNVTDDDVRASYDQLQRDPDAPIAVQLSHILIKLPEHPTTQQIAAAKDKAGKAMDMVKGGQAFAEVAKQVSEDSSTSQSGGELGWFQSKSIDPAWEPTVMSMQKGDVRGPVTDSHGVHVFYLTDIKPLGLAPYAQMKDKLKSELEQRELDKATQNWAQELRKKAYIDIKL
jgi:parvulin-like peptidyl-prolyl isomerase